MRGDVRVPLLVGGVRGKPDSLTSEGDLRAALIDRDWISVKETEDEVKWQPAIEFVDDDVGLAIIAVPVDGSTRAGTIAGEPEGSAGGGIGLFSGEARLPTSCRTNEDRNRGWVSRTASGSIVGFALSNKVSVSKKRAVVLAPKRKMTVCNFDFRCTGTDKLAALLKISASSLRVGDGLGRITLFVRTSDAGFGLFAIGEGGRDISGSFAVDGFAKELFGGRERFLPSPLDKSLEVVSMGVGAFFFLEANERGWFRRKSEEPISIGIRHVVVGKAPRTGLRGWHGSVGVGEG